MDGSANICRYCYHDSRFCGCKIDGLRYIRTSTDTYRHGAGQRDNSKDSGKENTGQERQVMKPDYYRRTIKGIEIEAIDIIRAWNLSYSEGEALTHLLRAKFKGCKEQDYLKVISHVKEAMND
jgi:hypothetical protein